MNYYYATKAIQRYFENFNVYVYDVLYKIVVLNTSRACSNLIECAYG